MSSCQFATLRLITIPHTGWSCRHANCHSPTYHHPTYRLVMSSCQVPHSTYHYHTYNQPKLNQNVLKKISIKTAVRMLLQFHFEAQLYILLNKLCSFYFATERLLIWLPLDMLEGVYFTPLFIFVLRPDVRNPVRESGRTRRQSGVDCKMWVLTPCVLELPLSPQYGGSMLLRKVATHLPDCTMS
jgi:hypothetical protein